MELYQVGRKRDSAGPERGGPAAPGLLGGPAAASPALLAHTMHPLAGRLGPWRRPGRESGRTRVLSGKDRLVPRPASVVSGGGGQLGMPLSTQTCP